MAVDAESSPLFFEPAPPGGFSPALVVRGERTPISFRPIVEDGQVIGDLSFGVVRDVDGAPLDQRCNNLDFSSLQVVDGTTFLLTHVECQPAALYLTALDEEMKPSWTRPVDLSAVGGGSFFCAGDFTPWNTHLASEEYESDARQARPTGGVADGWRVAEALFFFGVFGVTFVEKSVFHQKLRLFGKL